MRLALVTIGQTPRTDLTPEVRSLLPSGTLIVEQGALDGLDRRQIERLAPRPRERVLTSRLRDGSSAVFGHDQCVPLLQRAIERAEDGGADVSLVMCASDFPGVRHRRPLFLVERLAHDGVRALLGGMSRGMPRLGVVRPLREQVAEAGAHWERSIGIRPVVEAANPYLDADGDVAEASRRAARGSDLVVLDCIGYDEQMRAEASAACGDVPVVTVRSVAVRLVGSLLR